MSEADVHTPAYSGPLGFFRRHYEGDYSLGRSYWVHTFLIQWIAGVSALLLLPWLGEILPARYASGAFLAIFLLTLVLWLWAVAGTWASASKHVSRGGKSGWATAAKVAIVLGAIKMFGDVGQAMPALTEHSRVAGGWQLGAPTALQVRADGKSVLLSGGINDGSAEQLETVLKLAPGATTVVLTSEGGWIREGRLLAEVIRKRGLNTYVEEYCASACTVAFLAGKERAAAPRARIGFHSSRAVGAGDASDQSALRALYREAGLPAAFIKRAMETPNGEMWFPSHDMLIGAAVLTRRSTGGETAAMATAVRTRTEFEAQMRKLEFFRLFEKRRPAQYEAAIDEGWRKMEQGASDAAVTLAIRGQLMPAVVNLVPLATDDTLVAYLDLMVEQVRALQKRDAAACVAFSFPSGNVLPTSSMPQELLQRELVMLTQVLREMDEKRRMKPSQSQVERVAAKAFAQMPPDQIEIFADEAVRARTSPEAVCTAAVEFFEGLTEIPQPERGQAVRIVFSNN